MDPTTGNGASTDGESRGLPRSTLLDILEGTSLIFYIKRVDGRYLFVNRRYSEVANIPADYLVDKVDADLFPEPVAKLFRQQDEQVMNERRAIEFEETIPLPGGVLSFVTSKFPLINAEGDVYAVCGFCTDITSRAPREDESLSVERERLAVTLRSISESVISTDVEGAVLTVNLAAEQLTGFIQSSAYGRPLNEVMKLPSVTFDLVRKILDEGRDRDFGEHQVESATQGLRTVVVAGAPVRDRAHESIGAVFSIRDITERVRMEEELLNARKLESLGLLAGGIAHDFNNLLTTVLGNMSMARESTDDPDSLKHYLQTCERAVLQARGLTRQLLTFSKGGEPLRERSDFGRLVRDAAAFSVSGSNVRARFEIPELLWAAELDRAQFGQVIQNLTINARQAMPSGGEISFVCRNVLLEEGHGVAGLENGCFVEVTVTDQGGGIPDDAVGRVFDPYFSTRKQGTGLGLSIVFSIVRRHGGAIFVDNLPGAGAQFRLLFPADTDEAPAEPVEQISVRTKGAQILIMDDDPGVRETLATVLLCLGYKVQQAAEGHQVIELYGAAMGTEQAIDLVILDLTIVDGMGGQEAIRKLREMDPDITAIISSGYSEDPCLVEYRDHGFAGTIQKPYSIDELSNKIESVLAS